MDNRLIVRLKKSEGPKILTVQNSLDAEFFMANLRQYHRSCAPIIPRASPRKKSSRQSNARHSVARRTCGTAKNATTAANGARSDAEAMDRQRKTVKRIGDTLGIKPASVEAFGIQPPSGEAIGAKTAQ
jgi:hypothetical protein